MPYQAIQGMFDAGVPHGSRNYWRSGYVDELTDEAIEAIVAHADGVPAPLGQLHVHQLGGAMSRVPAGSTAFGNRDAGENTTWVRAASAAMEPYGTGARHVNFLADEGEAGVRSAYEAETFTRLQSLKSRYDPTTSSISTRTSSRLRAARLVLGQRGRSGSSGLSLRRS